MMQRQWLYGRLILVFLLLMLLELRVLLLLLVRKSPARVQDGGRQQHLLDVGGLLQVWEVPEIGWRLPLSVMWHILFLEHLLGLWLVLLNMGGLLQVRVVPKMGRRVPLSMLLYFLFL
jgi:hypothetical protein